jgi:hypothetical protein
LGSTVIWRLRASGEASPVLVPLATLPLRAMAPAMNSSDSISVVLPDV